jgi:hypothetical protein
MTTKHNSAHRARRVGFVVQQAALLALLLFGVSPFAEAGPRSADITVRPSPISTSPAHARAGTIVIEGTNGDDTVVVTAIDADGGSYRINDGSEIPFRHISSFTFNGGDGNDTLRIVNPPDGLFAPRDGIFCNGGEQSGAPGDLLDIIGGASSDTSFTMGPGPDAGTIRHEHNGVTQLIQFTGLEPVNDTVAVANFIFTAPNGATTVNIIDGPVVSGFQTTQINDGGTGQFESVNFANKTSVTVNGGPGINTFNINNPTKAVGLNNLTVDTGGQATEVINAGVVNIPGLLVLTSTGGSIQINSGAGVTATGGVRMTTGGAITLAGSVTASSIGINAGGAITQASGAAISTTNLLLLGAGPVTLTDPANSVVGFSGKTTGPISFTNAGQMTLFSISIAGFGSATGLSTTDAAISVNTINGGLDVNQPVSAGTSTVAITSGSSPGQDQTLNINSMVTGTGGVTLSGDHMNLTNASAAVNAGTNIATLRPFELTTGIALGGVGGAGIMLLLDGELDKVTANVLRVGDVNNTGGLTVGTSITNSGAGYSALVLLNGALLSESGGGVLTQAKFGFRASGVTLTNPSNAITNLAGAATGEFVTSILISNSIPVNIADVDSLTGLSATAGGITLVNTGTISLTSANGPEAVTGGTSGVISLVANGATADVISLVDNDAITNPGGDVNVQAGRDILFGTAGNFDNDVRANGQIFFSATRDVIVGGSADIASDDFSQGTGSGVIIVANRNISVTGSDASIGASGSASADVSLTTGLTGQLTVSANGQGAIFSASGDVTVNADRIVIDPTSGISAVSGSVLILQRSNAWSINVGSPGNAGASTLELSDAELDRMFAPTLQIGDAANTGTIVVSAAISASSYSTLVLRNNGPVGGAGSVTVPALSFIDGGSAARVYTINGTANTFQKSGGIIVPFATALLTVSSGSSSDTFNVKASTTATINIDGKNPFVAPGDVLNYDGEGRAVSGDASPPTGSITSTGVKPVNFQSIEAVNVSNFVPSISITDVTVNEGNAGTTDAVFTVSLIAPFSSTVTVDFFTSGGTATEGADYQARSGTRTFTAGVTSATITVPVNGDTTPEINETFFVNLTDPTNSVIADNQGLGTITNDDGPVPSPTPTPTATATSTPNPTATATATPAVGLVGNVSTRLPVGTGDNVLIEGFIVQGPSGSTKKIIVRAIGPSLLPFGIADAIANPTLEIRDANNTLIAANDNWMSTQVGGIISSDQSSEILGSGVAPGNDVESAIIANLDPGSYTAIVRGLGDTVGTGVVDAYDLSAMSPARLANIATRGLIQPGDKLMIAGFIIQNGPVTAVILATGPSLTAFGIANALPDTTLQLRDQNGVIVRENDDWQSDQMAELEATGLQPSDPKEAAMIVTIPPGQYTAQVRGKPEATGIGVVQVFFLQ